MEHTLRYPEEVSGTSVVIVLRISDEHRLEALAEDLPGPVSTFREPDLGEQMTALAVISSRDNPRLRRLSPLHAREEVRT